jgi:hypothetical protein
MSPARSRPSTPTASSATRPGRLLLIGPTDTHPASWEHLLGLVNDHPGRTGTAVVTVGQHRQGGVVVELTGDGRIRIPSMGLDLVAVGLTGDEALGCAALVAQSDPDATDIDIPHQTDADGWHSFADEAGALRTEHTQPRDPRSDSAAASTTSVLPRDDNDYLHVAATTAEDLAVLAPQVPADVRQAVQDADPTLDADIDAWFADDSDVPRLTLLGPVHARTNGVAIAKRRPYYTELLAYLATRPHGATPEEVADAFSLTGPRVRNDIKVLRDWLGVNPRTGRKHLPDARDSAAARAGGVGCTKSKAYWSTPSCSAVFESVANPAGRTASPTCAKHFSWSLASPSTSYAPAAGVGCSTATGSTIT